MKLYSIRNKTAIFGIILAAGLGVATTCFARDTSYGQASYGQAGNDQAQKLNPKEEADYKAFTVAPDDDKKVQLGEKFLQKYPTSRYTIAIYNVLVPIYYGKQDWNNFYGTADKAIAKNPDDVDVLTIVGWVIPHNYNKADPDQEKKLDKAESYEKHALEVIPNLPKPANLTDDQFAAAKQQQMNMAHSGLGLVYFRTQDYENSVKELLQATSTSSPDPSDLYVLAIELNALKRYSEAGDAFQKCAQITGDLQARCKQSAEQATSLGGPSK